MPRSEFETYLALREQHAFREAYTELRTVMNDYPEWSKIGDVYVWCAELELLTNADAHAAQLLLDEASRLGCTQMAPHHRVHGIVLCRTGDRDAGIEELRKSIVLDRSVVNLTALAMELSDTDDGSATDVCEEILRQEPSNCVAHACLARVAHKAGDKGNAIVLAKRAETLARFSGEFYEIGGLYADIGEFCFAINAYFEAERLGYEVKSVLYAAIAECYFMLQDDSLAERYLAWAMRHNSEHQYVKTIKNMIDKGKSVH
jgi:tetratricopeptide (TPR) repeat protein